MYSQIKLIFALNLSLFLSTVYTQSSNDIETLIKTYPQVKIDGTEVREPQSSVTDEKYYIYVGLPRSYSDSMETYPALYIMDADGAFGTCTEYLLLTRKYPN